MAQITEEINIKIRKFINYPEKTGIHIETAILFGSYSKGLQNKWSDIDLALVSNDFEGSRFNDNMKLMKTVLKVNSDIETHPFRPEDFSIENPFVAEILRYGYSFK